MSILWDDSTNWNRELHERTGYIGTEADDTYYLVRAVESAGHSIAGIVLNGLTHWPHGKQSAKNHLAFLTALSEQMEADHAKLKKFLSTASTEQLESE